MRRKLNPGIAVVVAGATSGDQPGAELARVFFPEVRVVGVTMGAKEDLAALLRFCARSGVRPVIDSAVPLSRVAGGLARLASGEQFGKVVVTMPG